MGSAIMKEKPAQRRAGNNKVVVFLQAFCPCGQYKKGDGFSS
jgi:hypothetical protein